MQKTTIYFALGSAFGIGVTTIFMLWFATDIQDLSEIKTALVSSGVVSVPVGVAAWREIRKYKIEIKRASGLE